MKVGTDGLLLGAWASLPTYVSLNGCAVTKDSAAYLDIGSGSGLISLMLAQRAPQATIRAIELDSDAARQAEHNFRQSSFASRLQLLKGDILTYQPAERYALIVSNPPFFDNALLGSNGKRNQARHTASLPLPLLLAKAAELLAPGGSLALVLPEPAAEAFSQLAGAQGWFAMASCQVFSRADKAPLRRLMQWQRVPCQPRQQQLLIHNDDGSYSEQYRHLLRDFYLKF
ncbi:tRNA1(Val) (adenine(37)-N6)-methyltransferase [Arsukibacterium tuosuense]|nr:methyltransferase [Arsukibacterium tuosuense]